MPKMIVIVTIVLALITGASTAHEVTLNPSEDAAIHTAYPDSNYGDWNYAWIGYNNGWTVSLVYFDLSEYMEVTVETAILELYLHNPWGTIPDNNWIKMADGAWDESTVTWNTNPGFNEMHSLFFADPMMGWLSLDVTAFVEDWVDGICTNYGFFLYHLDATYSGFHFNTKEGSHKPKLTITYQYSDLESTTFGCIKTLFNQE